MNNLVLFEYYIENFYVNGNRYWFEVRDPKDYKGYSVGWGVGDIKDDNISKFNRTNRHEQFKIFSEIKKMFIKWFNENNPDTFYFSVPGEKRMNIYIKFINKFLKGKYKYEIIKTDYEPFDLKEKNVYYVIFNKKLNEALEIPKGMYLYKGRPVNIIQIYTRKDGSKRAEVSRRMDRLNTFWVEFSELIPFRSHLQLPKNENKKMKHLKLFEKFNKKEIEKGIEIEKEHDKTYQKIKSYYEKHNDFPGKSLVFKWIAEDHLSEFKDYYERLDKIEKEAKLDIKNGK